MWVSPGAGKINSTATAILRRDIIYLFPKGPNGALSSPGNLTHSAKGRQWQEKVLGRAPE